MVRVMPMVTVCVFDFHFVTLFSDVREQDTEVMFIEVGGGHEDRVVKGFDAFMIFTKKVVVVELLHVFFDINVFS